MSNDFNKQRALARLLIRLMGVFLAINGITGVISSGLDSYWIWRYTQHNRTEYFPDQALAWTIGSAAMLLIGLYLIFGGKMAMDAVFHDKLDAAAIPCSGCGYDLRGTTEGSCPECGLPVPRNDPPAKVD